MKEKTFEELVEEIHYNITNSFRKAEIIDLLQQVREATIEEVLKLADDNFFSKESKGKLMENIENLPTDRIKTEK